MIFLNFENIINIFTSTKYDSFYLFWKLIAIHSSMETALCVVLKSTRPSSNQFIEQSKLSNHGQQNNHNVRLNFPNKTTELLV